MNRFRYIVAKAWRDVKQSFSWRNVLTFFLFVVFATILWFGRALNVVREREMSVAISYIGIADNIAFEQKLPDKLYFTVRDQGKRLQKYRSSDFSAIEIDMSQLLTARQGTVHLSTEIYRQRITDQLQGTAKLQRMRPENIVADYYRQESKTVSVVFDGKISCASQYQLTNEPQLTPSQIKIFGKKQVIDTIKAVHTDFVSISGAKDTIQQSVALLPIADVRFQTNEVELTALAEQFTEKVFNLPVIVMGVPTQEYLRTFPSTVKVTLRVPLAHFNQVNEDDVQVVCQYPKEKGNTLPLKLKHKSKYITYSRLSPEEVEYMIEKR